MNINLPDKYLNAKTDTLIKHLLRIDCKLSVRYCREERSFIDRFGRKIKLCDINVPVYPTYQLIAMYSAKASIIMTLHQRGIVTDKELDKYMLSEDLAFTPKLILNKGSYTKKK